MKRLTHVPRLALVLAVLFSANLALAQGLGVENNSHRYTLSDCVQIALERSPRIQAAEDGIRKAESEVGMARAGFFPRLTAFGNAKSLDSIRSSGNSNSDYDDQFTLSHGLQLTQSLFAGLTIFNNYQRAVLALEFAWAQKDETVARLTLEVQSIFLERLQAIEQAEVHKAHLRSLETNGKALEAMFAQNLVPFSAVLDVNAEIADARQKLSEAENAVSVRTIELQGLMHVPFESNDAFEKTVLVNAYEPVMPIDEVRRHALDNNPSIRLAKLGIQIIRKDKDAALGAFAPRVNLTLSYNNIDVDYDKQEQTFAGGYDRDYETGYAVGMLSFEWDLFQGGKDYYQVQRAKHEINRLLNNLNDLESTTHTDIEKSYTLLQEARSRAGHADAFLKSAREKLAMAQARLDKSMGTLPEFMLARSTVQDAQASVISAQIDFQLAMANLNYYMGRQSLPLIQ